MRHWAIVSIGILEQPFDRLQLITVEERSGQGGFDVLDAFFLQYVSAHGGVGEGGGCILQSLPW